LEKHGVKKAKKEVQHPIYLTNIITTIMILRQPTQNSNMIM